MSSGTLEPDLCVIGGGAGGVTLALGAAACGLSVVLAEKATLGGNRLTDGILRQALISASRASLGSRRAALFGIKSGEPQVDFRSVRQHAGSVLAAITPNYTQARLEAANVKVIRATGRFIGTDCCEAGGSRIAAKRFAIAAGSVARTPSLPGLELIRPLDCAALCALEEPPRHLLVAGADPEGLAIAQALCHLGSSVTIITSGTILANEDQELAACVRAAITRDGVTLIEGVRIARMEPRGDNIRVFIAAAGHEKAITGTHILIASGRAPALAGLNLSAAHVRYDGEGVAVNGKLATSNPRISAIGSVVRGARGSGAPERDAFIVLQDMLGMPPATRTPERLPAPQVISTSPPLATVGLSEAQARAKHGHIIVLRWPYAETERACLEHSREGHLKLIASHDRVLLGAAVAGVAAEELINLLALAISTEVTVEELAALAATFPSCGAAVRAAAGAIEGWKGCSVRDRAVAATSRSIAWTALEIKELGPFLWDKAGQLARRAKALLSGKN